MMQQQQKETNKQLAERIKQQQDPKHNQVAFKGAA